MLNTAEPHQRRGGRAALAALLSLSVLSSSSLALGETKNLPRLGLDPAEPQVPSAAPSIPMGTPASSSQYVLDFHGYLLLPLRVGVLKRDNPSSGQSDTALHTPPLIPQNIRRFQYTAAIPDTWTQLNFTYGNSLVAATVILAARSLTDATGLFNPVEQLGVNDAFLTLNLSQAAHVPLQVRVGAMTGRYGSMGMYDAGRYATPLIARTNSVGESVTAAFDLGPSFKLALEQGFGGQLARPPRDFVPAGWNGFAPKDVGTSFVNHVHAGLAYTDLLQVGLHYFTAFTKDDLATNATPGTGRISVIGADARLTAGRFGHLYVGAAHTDARDASGLGGVIEVLNARGGAELMAEYWGPNSGGNGSLDVLGAQYDLSLARLAFADGYQGKSPDLRLSLFGAGVSVKSDDAAYDGRKKLKAGVEATYDLTSWFGVSTRVDHVRPNTSDTHDAFTAFSPRLLFHTDWQSRDELALQWSHFIYGSTVVVESGSPPVPDPRLNPDSDVFSLSATFWW